MLEKANYIYQRLMIELSIRKNNQHVGSGLGGNPTLFLTMLALTPRFEEVSDKDMFVVDGDNLFINVDKFTQAKFLDVRKALDASLSKDITDKYAPAPFVLYLEEGTSFDGSNLNLSTKQKDLVRACALGAKLRLLVEKEFEPGKALEFNSCSQELQNVYNELASLDDWFVVLAFRRMVQIDTIVKYNLDETFGELLNKINKKVELPV